MNIFSFFGEHSRDCAHILFYLGFTAALLKNTRAGYIQEHISRKIRKMLKTEGRNLLTLIKSLFTYIIFF